MVSSAASAKAGRILAQIYFGRVCIDGTSAAAFSEAAFGKLCKRWGKIRCGYVVLFTADNYQAVTGDVIVAELSDGNKEYRRFFRMTFLDAYTIIGETCRAAYPVMWADRGVVVNEKDSVQTFSDEKEHTVLLILEEGIDTVRFSMGYSGHSVEEAILRAQNGMQACVKTVVDQNLDFYNHISRPTNDKLFARTYAKAFSVLRTNVPGI